MGECRTCAMSGIITWGRFSCADCNDQGGDGDFCEMHAILHKKAYPDHALGDKNVIMEQLGLPPHGDAIPK